MKDDGRWMKGGVGFADKLILIYSRILKIWRSRSEHIPSSIIHRPSSIIYDENIHPYHRRFHLPALRGDCSWQRVYEPLPALFMVAGCRYQPRRSGIIMRRRDAPRRCRFGWRQIRDHSQMRKMRQSFPHSCNGQRRF